MMKKLYDKYQKEYSVLLPKNGMTFEEFRSFAGNALAGMKCIETADGGVMYYEQWKENGILVCDVPVFGYSASSEKDLSGLFCALSEEVLKNGTTLFQIHLYANDTEAQRLFSMMQFGYMSEKGIFDIRNTEYHSDKRWTIRTLTKEEIRGNWDGIWKMTSGIIRHLQSAPVFYPGTEFTEEVYREFYMDDDTAVHVAFSGERMIGMIESNRETEPLCGSESRCVNVGEIYVIPEYRGSGAARQLLFHAAEYEKKCGAEALWVEHGTANPNARGFWNQYFTTCQYEMVREISTVQIF